MTTKRLLALLLVVMAVTVAVARTRSAARAAPDAQRYAVIGVVTAPPAEGRVMVAHEEIPGYMPAMTMPFAVDPAAPPAVKAGDRVRFTLLVAAEWSRAEAFEVTGYDEAIAAALDARRTSSSARLRPGDAVPAFALTTDAGEPFTLDDLRGHATAVTFIFTRCPVPEFCPLMSRRFQQIQRETARDPALRGARLLSVTLDPTFDTPAVLDAYARAIQADPARWRFVTGTPDEIGRLSKAFAIHAEKNGVFLDHTLATAVIGPDGRITEIWRGNHWTATQVVDALRSASAGSDRQPSALPTPTMVQ
jgi:protein SCO1/2